MTIVIQCQDRVGLISIISTILRNADCNIVSMRQHVAADVPLFFARIVTDDMQIEATAIKEKLVNALPLGAMVTVNPPQKKKIVVLVTKEYHCLGDILLRNNFDNLNAEVIAVVGNYNELSDLTKKFGVPFHYISHENITKELFESRVKECIDKYTPDYLVLAKFMRILSPDFVAHFAKKIINIHHSFLPAFIGANPYKKAYERGVKLIGATAHFVTNDLDEGPIITQQVIPVNHTYTAESMRKAGREIETSTLAEAMQLVFEDRVFVYKNKTVIFK